MTNLQKIENQIAILKDKLDTVRGSACEVYTRIVGYYRQVGNWNKGAAAQRKKRVNYDLEKSNKKSWQTKN